MAPRQLGIITTTTSTSAYQDEGQFFAEISYALSQPTLLLASCLLTSCSVNQSIYRSLPSHGIQASLPPSSSFVSGRFGSFFIQNAPPGLQAPAALRF